MLRKQYIDITLNQGVDNRTDGKLSGKPSKLENCVLSESGTISKRRAYKSFGSSIFGGGFLNNGKALATLLDELVILAGGGIYSWSKTAEKSSLRGAHTQVAVTKRRLIRKTTDVKDLDTAVLSNVRLVTYLDSEARAYVLDEQNGAPIQVAAQLEAGASTGLVASTVFTGSSRLAAIWWNQAGSIKMRTLDPASPNSFASAVTLRTDIDAVGATARLDVAPLTGSNTKVAVGYRTTTPSVRLVLVDSSGATVAGPVTVAETPINGFAVACSSDAGADRVWVVWQSSSGTKPIRAAVFDGTLGTVTAAFTVLANADAFDFPRIGLYADGSICTILLEKSAASAKNTQVWKGQFLSNGTVSTTPVAWMRSVGLASKPTLVGGSLAAAVVHESALQSTLFLADADASSGALRAKSTYGNGGGLFTTSRIPNCASSKVPFLENSGADIVGADGLSLLTWDTNFSPVLANAGSCVLVSGGIVRSYDGTNIVEHGFHLYPEDLSAASPGAGSVANGTYQYCALYEWYDAQGRRHQSAPSVPVSHTVSGGPKQVDVTVPTLRLSDKSDVRVVIFRTEASGSVFYRLGAVANSTTNDTLTYSDNTTDANLVAGELLYTTGGVLDNIGAPAAKWIHVHGRRVWLGGLEDGRTLWYSQEQSESAPVEFSDALTRSLPENEEACNGLGSLDDKLVAFTETGIYVQSGLGPNLAGQQSDFSELYRVSSDVGCQEPRSIVAVPMGVVFQSGKRNLIYLLDRGLSVQPIGLDVQDLGGAISDAVLDGDRTQVRFLGASETLVWDYALNQWSTFSYTGKAAIVYDGKYTFIGNDSILYQEKDSSDADQRDISTDYVVSTVVTPWFKVGGVQGLQRIWRLLILGTYKAATTLEVSVGYNYKDAYEYTFSTTLASIEASSGVPVQLRHHLRVQKCESIRFKIRDTGASAGSPYSGFDLTGLSLEVGVRGIGYKVKQAQSVA